VVGACFLVAAVWFAVGSAALGDYSPPYIGAHTILYAAKAEKRWVGQ
jgi:hypothetical protein